MNIELKTILDDFSIGDARTGDEAGDTLLRRLTEREDEKLDLLRVQAMQQGLYPSITAWVLAQTGMGTPIEPEVLAALHNQAKAEVAQIAEAMEQYRRRFPEGGE